MSSEHAIADLQDSSWWASSAPADCCSSDSLQFGNIWSLVSRLNLTATPRYHWHMQELNKEVSAQKQQPRKALTRAKVVRPAAAPEVPGAAAPPWMQHVARFLQRNRVTLVVVVLVIAVMKLRGCAVFLLWPSHCDASLCPAFCPALCHRAPLRGLYCALPGHCQW